MLGSYYTGVKLTKLVYNEYLALKLRNNLCQYVSGFQQKSIYALSSGYGKCGVAVIRISGPHSANVVNELGKFKKLPEPRKAILRYLRDPITNNILDRGLLIWFPGPNSFTGFDCCELQVHGGSAVIAAVLNALAKIPGLRPAGPGEFSKQAFYNGKMDLTEAEGLADLIHAETEMQRLQAFHQMEGSLHNLYSSWKHILKQSVAHVEAYIDFSEDQNIEDNILGDTNKNLVILKDALQCCVVLETSF
uniref:GTP-binding protein TrmE N-terminal domain-containing protein n=1 Tax=Clastoptera arizonana TaxID=38151 RepID=A0A1B6CCA8_9HEMI